MILQLIVSFSLYCNQRFSSLQIYFFSDNPQKHVSTLYNLLSIFKCLSTYKISENKKAKTYIVFAILCEPKAGLEPATYALRMRCSTN